MKCKHKCDNCEETWECKFPYYSKFQYFKVSVNNGYYCNSYCPNCQPDKREEIDELFENLSETGYVKPSIEMKS